LTKRKYLYIKLAHHLVKNINNAASWPAAAAVPAVGVRRENANNNSLSYGGNSVAGRHVSANCCHQLCAETYRGAASGVGVVKKRGAPSKSIARRKRKARTAAVHKT
jgi:hypothetical protein